jgi:PadR family transcriptional regulator, regulatory protein PadR
MSKGQNKTTFENLEILQRTCLLVLKHALAELKKNVGRQLASTIGESITKATQTIRLPLSHITRVKESRCFPKTSYKISTRSRYRPSIGTPMPNTPLLQGTLDVLILRALALDQMHGLGVSRRIAQVTSGTFQVKPGSLFPALHRMEEAGWLASSWGESENNRRAKFYRLTNSGRKQLKEQTEQWALITAAMASALGS